VSGTRLLGTDKLPNRHVRVTPLEAIETRRDLRLCVLTDQVVDEEGRGEHGALHDPSNTTQQRRTNASRDHAVRQPGSAAPASHHDDVLGNYLVGTSQTSRLDVDAWN
jgi:hypothetical protein